MTESFDTIIIGAGAAGLFHAYLAAEKSSVLILEKNRESGRKILISGGGRCNYTNGVIRDCNFIGGNSKRLSKYFKLFGPDEILSLFTEWGIDPIEKKQGQYFSSLKAKGLRDLLLKQVLKRNVKIRYSIELKCSDIDLPTQVGENFRIRLKNNYVTCQKLVIASGGLSFPGLGVSSFAYQLARHLRLNVTMLKPGLVPFVLKKRFISLAGNSCDVEISINDRKIKDSLLFTHKGISGPAVLRISSYWEDGQTVAIDFLPEINLLKEITGERKRSGKQEIKTYLRQYLPRKIIDEFFRIFQLKNLKIAELSKSDLKIISQVFEKYKIIPIQTEGYPRAEVTVGGIDLNELNDRLESKKYSGLFFIGEVCNVTGDLGGFNFQWAWTSAYLAHQTSQKVKI